MDMQKLLDIMDNADQQPVNEAINKDSPLYKEYESLKAKSVKDLKRIYQQNHRIDTSGFDFGGKANIISDILRDRHGVKKLKVLYNESVNEGMNDNYYYGAQQPAETEQTSVTYSKNHQSENGRITITAEASGVAELQELLQMAGLSTAGVQDRLAQAEPEEVCDQCGDPECTCPPGECSCGEEPEQEGPTTLSYRYETDKDKIIDTIKDRLKAKLGL